MNSSLSHRDVEVSTELLPKSKIVQLGNIPIDRLKFRSAATFPNLIMRVVFYPSRRMSEAEPTKLQAGVRVLVTASTNVEFVEMLQTCILYMVDKLVAHADKSCTDNTLLFASAGAGRSGGLETATPPVPTSSTLLII